MDSINIDLHIDNDRLFDFAASDARLLLPRGGYMSTSVRRTLLRRSFRELERLHAQMEKRCADAVRIPAACEWMLDNWYLVQREYRTAVSELVSIKPLRRCEDTEMIYELCAALLRSGAGEVSELRCGIFLRGFQSVTVLEQRELRAFAVFLRCAVIDAILSVCRGMQFSDERGYAAQRLGALFSSLRLFAVLDTAKLTESVNVIGAILARDPTGDYPHMDEKTRGAYLEQVERLAEKKRLSEQEFAEKLLERAQSENRHIGEYLFDDSTKRGRACLYIAANLLLTLGFTLGIAFMTGKALNAVLLLLPVWELVKSVTDWTVLHLVKPKVMPCMDVSAGIPPEGRTVCVCSVLLTDEKSARDAALRLEQLRLSQRGGRHLRFGLLADLKAAKEKEMPEDEAVIAAAREAVNELNRRYGGGFYLFWRDRSPDGERWSGHERKRGALIELAKLLSERESSLHVVGERDALAGTKYIMTLDADTFPYPGALCRLIGTMLHPLVRPRLDRERGIVTAGRGILHPRVSNELLSANATDFAVCFSGGGGSDPYGTLCAELYMDTFHSGGFAGKGIIDVESLLVCTQKHIPEGRVLSHDALEGALLRGGYVGDVELFDSFPEKPLSYYKRMHRWVRGDWQNSPWIFSRGRELEDIDRWRLFDSLRRSATPPMTFIALTCGLLFPKYLSAAAWAALLSMTARIFMSLAEHRNRTRPRLRRYTRILSGVGGAIVHSFIHLWLLPYSTLR